MPGCSGPEASTFAFAIGVFVFAVGCRETYLQCGCGKATQLRSSCGFFLECFAAGTIVNPARLTKKATSWHILALRQSLTTSRTCSSRAGTTAGCRWAIHRAGIVGFSSGGSSVHTPSPKPTRRFPHAPDRSDACLTSRSFRRCVRHGSLAGRRVIRVRVVVFVPLLASSSIIVAVTRLTSLMSFWICNVRDAEFDDLKGVQHVPDCKCRGTTRIRYP